MFPVIPRKSGEDKREYRFIQLENRLEVLLVSDPETDKAAAAMDVHVGQLSDPDTLPGLAHFCEHMLFLGTEKYPDEDSYSSFLNSHGGQSNAYTALENTNYFFDITHDHLEGALDRFAQFFIAPLFTKGATDRELQAVNNEHAKNLNNDHWREYQFLKSTSNPKHPFSHFGSGNLVTLKERPKQQNIDVRQALLDFHSTYYSANIMKLCIIGREPLDTLQQWSVAMFSKVVNTGREVPVFPGLPLLPENMGKIYRIVPVKDLRSLELSFQMPSTHPVYHYKPTNILGNMVGHEGHGSILALLKKKSWANSLSAGSDESTGSFSLFNVNIELTEAGLEHVEDIVRMVFQYLSLLFAAQESEFRRHFTDLNAINEMNFLFKGKETPFSYCSSLAQQMQKFSPDEVLTGPTLFKDFSFPVLRDFLKHLNATNFRAHIVSRSFEGKTDKKEEWYGTSYSEEPLPEAWVKAVTQPGAEPELFLPPSNEFLATDFRLRPCAAELKVPQELLQEASLRMWYKSDHIFLKPKVFFYSTLSTPWAYASPAAAVLTDLYTHLLEDSLAEYAYDAEIAGLRHSLTASLDGLSLVFAGYNHKMPVLVRKVVERMRNLEIKEDRFQVIKEDVTRFIRNFELEQPYQHAVYDQQMALEAGRWHYTERLAVIDRLTADDVRAHQRLLFSEMHVESFVHGNMDAGESEELVRLVRDTLVDRPLSVSQFREKRCVQLQSGYEYMTQQKEPNKADANSAAHAHFQLGPWNVALEARVSMLAHLISDPCFTQLRTNEQLGYMVFSGKSDGRGILGLRIIVQSGDHPADYLDQRIEAFLELFRGTLANMPEDQFDTNRKAVIAKRLEKDKTLSHEAERHWNEINQHRYAFLRNELVAAELQLISKAQLLEFFEECIAPNAPHRRKLCSQVFGNAQLLPAERPAKQSAEAAHVPSAAERKAHAEAELAELLQQVEEVKASGQELPAEALAAVAQAEAAVAAAVEAPKPLPPVPESRLPLKKLDHTNYPAFWRCMPLFPNMA